MNAIEIKIERRRRENAMGFALKKRARSEINGQKVSAKCFIAQISSTDLSLAPLSLRLLYSKYRFITRKWVWDRKIVKFSVLHVQCALSNHSRVIIMDFQWHWMKFRWTWMTTTTTTTTTTKTIYSTGQATHSFRFFNRTWRWAAFLRILFNRKLVETCWITNKIRNKHEKSTRKMWRGKKISGNDLSHQKKSCVTWLLVWVARTEFLYSIAFYLSLSHFFSIYFSAFPFSAIHSTENM